MKKNVKLAAYYLAFAVAVAARPAVAYAEPEEITTESAAESPGETPEEETQRTLSSDNSLSSIEIVQGQLVPAFSPEQLTYTMTVPNETDRITLRAQTNDGSAKKTITGTSELEVGENTVVIKVTAEDGSIRIYQIAVTREAGEGAETSESQENTESTDHTDDTQEASDGESASDSGEETREQEEGLTDGNSQEDSSGEAQSGTPDPAAESGSGSLSEKDQFVVNPSQEEGSFLDTYRLPILIGLVALLIVLCIVAAVLLLKRRPAEDEEGMDQDSDDDGDGEDEFDSEYDRYDEEEADGGYEAYGEDESGRAEYDAYDITDESGRRIDRDDPDMPAAEEEDDDFEFLESAGSIDARAAADTDAGKKQGAAVRKTDETRIASNTAETDMAANTAKKTAADVDADAAAYTDEEEDDFDFLDL